MDRFWSKVKVVGADECWLWQGHRQPRGYGTLRVNRKMVLAHRVAWQLKFGQIPAGLHILHSCDNPPCCNPTHLSPGTQSQNVQEAHDRGRILNHPRGERHYACKLSDQDVAEITRLYATGRYRQIDLAREFSVSDCRISQIVSRKDRRQLDL